MRAAQRNFTDSRSGHQPGRTMTAVAMGAALLSSACGSTAASDSSALQAGGETVVDVSAPSVPTDGGGDMSVEIVTTTSFGADGSFGVFEVAAGAEALGCEAGSFDDIDVLSGLFRTLTCETGERNGTFHLFFNEQEGMTGPGELNAQWEARSGTGDFAGLRGGGTWSADFVEGGISGSFNGDVEWAPFGTRDTGTGTMLAEDVLADVASRVEVPDGEGALMLAVLSNDATTHVSIGTDPSGIEPSPSDPFRIGSITKVFTAISILQLVDDRLIDLDDLVADYVETVPDGVTVRDLLSHTSGIANTHDVRNYVGMLVDDPERAWTPQETLNLVAELPPVFEPGGGHRYSNTNYLILGLLIEELTGQPYHEVVRSLIIEPLGLDTTYLAGAEDGPEPFGAYTGVTGRVGPVDFDYTSIATAAWSAGAMVSSADDLHTLFSELFDGQLISSSSIEQMTGDTRYGLGLELFEWTHGLVGHSGIIPGYITFVRHDVANDRTAIWVSTGPNIDPRPALAPFFMAFAADDH